MISRSDCTAMDADDPIAGLRDLFALPENTIYLDGNSLGARPIAAAERARELIALEWGQDLIRSWNKAGWFDLPSRLGDKLAPIVGAGAGELVVTDSTSVNLFKVLAAALRMQDATHQGRKKIIVSERANFPTDLYIAQSIEMWLDRGYRLHLVDTPEELPQAVDADTAVVLLTHVNYRTGYMHDMAALTAHAHAAGAVTVWDLAHSAGAVLVDLTGSGADFAVGCTYKYLNGGPGAPAFLWIAPRHQEQFRQPLSGWWSHAAPFAMQSEFQPTVGARRALCGTQPIVSLALVECGLDIFSQTDMQQIRKKSLALSDLFLQLVGERCAGHPLRLVTPKDHKRRGSQICLAHPHGYPIMQALIARGIIGDYREPEIMRFGFAPLYTRYADVWDAVDALATVLDEGCYDTQAHRIAVT